MKKFLNIIDKLMPLFVLLALIMSLILNTLGNEVSSIHWLAFAIFFEIEDLRNESHHNNML